jgi:hypothetical protein
MATVGGPCAKAVTVPINDNQDAHAVGGKCTVYYHWQPAIGHVIEIWTYTGSCLRPRPIALDPAADALTAWVLWKPPRAVMRCNFGDYIGRAALGSDL